MAAIIAVTASCGGGKSPTQPTPPLVLLSVSPSSGPSIGGTVITITGSDFAPGATVTVHGVAATDVTVTDATTLTATTGPGISGPADVHVTSGGRVGTLPGGFTYLLVENELPVIAAMSAQGTRPNEPSNLADLDEEITIAAAVSDTETPTGELTYEWTSEVGTFLTNGSTVRWKAPHDLPKTPVTYPLTLTIIEQYKTTDDTGAVITKENKVTGSVSVRVHNSFKETSDLVGTFLNDFADSTVSPESATRNFSTAFCPDGKANEIDDIRTNRSMYTINSHSYSSPAHITFYFSGFCPFRNRAGDACVDLSCHWVSARKKDGIVERADGRCYLSEVFEDNNDRWRLCWSDFAPGVPLTFDFPF